MPRRGLDVTPRFALLLIGDGRDDLKRETLASWEDRVTGGNLVTVVEVDDRAHALGFCGAIREGWARLRAVHAAAPFDYVFHLEEDWRFDRDVDLARMIDLLDVAPHLSQVALRRGPENEVEERAGGLVEVWPDEYRDRQMTVLDDPPAEWPYLEHRLFFTTNPSVYRRDLVWRFDWPEAPRCEQAFGLTLLAEGMSFAFWGSRSDAPWVTHTGRHQRFGRGY